MASPSATAVPATVLAVHLLLLLGAATAERKCRFEAIFNFGDSNSDTGGFWAAFPAQKGPFGMTYFKKPSGRASDGRLVVDFLAQALGLPLLTPYLQSTGDRGFQTGSNFATLGSTVLLPNTSLFVSGISPISLAIQLNQMKYLYSRTLELGQNGRLPSPDVFGRALYTIDIGQNDFTSKLNEVGNPEMQSHLSSVVNQITWTVKELYGIGARSFLIFNLAPVGCYPAFVVPQSGDDTAQRLDSFGCKVRYNEAVVAYNRMLEEAIKRIRPMLSGADLVYVDTHAVKLELFQHPTEHGLKYGTRACCGHGGGQHNYSPEVYCGNSKVINGENETASACTDPENYVSWDGIHATEAANKLVTMAFLDGNYTSPFFSISELCDLHRFH